MKFTVKQVKPINLFHLHFPHQIDMTLSLLRLQEYYESPKFRGKYFTLEEYIEWECKQEKDKPFSYIVDVGGMNVPGNVVIDWLEDFDDFSPKEAELVDFFHELIEDYGEQFYIIGTCGTLGDLKHYTAHEVRHAMFYLIPEYKRDILRVVRRFKLTSFKKKLLTGDVPYHKSVLEDEIHAYALTGFDSYYPNATKISDLPKELQRLRKELKAVERKYIKKGKIHVPQSS